MTRALSRAGHRTQLAALASQYARARRGGGGSDATSRRHRAMKRESSAAYSRTEPWRMLCAAEPKRRRKRECLGSV